ncbi:hypothetical protein AAKU67_003131 [Oxalobacteraceae bacterium GrIS 2.11]
MLQKILGERGPVVANGAEEGSRMVSSVENLCAVFLLFLSCMGSILLAML